MEMKYPPPRLSKFNPSVPQLEIDYSMSSPLLADGSKLPCKKYPKGQVVATFQAGSSITVEMFGTAVHGGGHCQFSVSYDDKTFVVLRTVMKNCFVGTGLNFPRIDSGFDSEMRQMHFCLELGRCDGGP